MPPLTRGLVPHLRRSDRLRTDSQPFRAGLKFSGRPSGPRVDFAVSFLSHFLLNLPLASRLPPTAGSTAGRAGGMTNSGVAAHPWQWWRWMDRTGTTAVSFGRVLFNAFTRLRVDHLYMARRASGFVTRSACPFRNA